MQRLYDDTFRIHDDFFLVDCLAPSTHGMPALRETIVTRGAETAKSTLPIPKVCEDALNWVAGLCEEAA